MNQRHRSRFFQLFVSRRVRRILFRRAQAAARWTALGIYLFLSLGIQLPLAVAKKSGQPYPCMNHPCGCASAEQCWRHCCCTTLEQRLAWAREHHVTPPDYALADARARGIDWETYCAVGAEHESRICRDGEEQPANCRQHVCHEEHRGQPQNGSSQHEDAPAAPPQGVVWIAALACQGSDLNWSGQTVSIPPPAEAQLADSPNMAEQLSVPTEQFSSISFAPTTPPPRSAAI